MGDETESDSIIIVIIITLMIMIIITINRKLLKLVSEDKSKNRWVRETNWGLTQVLCVVCL